MGLDKAIEHNKEHRKPYRRAKAIDRTCRNHGSDCWALSNRTHSQEKKKLAAKQRELEAEKELTYSVIKEYGNGTTLWYEPITDGIDVFILRGSHEEILSIFQSDKHVGEQQEVRAINNQL